MGSQGQFPALGGGPYTWERAAAQFVQALRLLEERFGKPRFCGLELLSTTR